MCFKKETQYVQYLVISATMGGRRDICIFQMRELHEVMMVALRDGKADFVELLIENGFVLESFMDNNRLEQLFALDMVGISFAYVP